MLQSFICTVQQHLYRKHPICVLQTINAGIPPAPGAVSAWAHQQAWEYSYTPAPDTHRVLPECQAAKNILPLQTYFAEQQPVHFEIAFTQFNFSRQRGNPISPSITHHWSSQAKPPNAKPPNATKLPESASC